MMQKGRLCWPPPVCGAAGALPRCALMRDPCLLTFISHGHLPLPTHLTPNHLIHTHSYAFTNCAEGQALQRCGEVSQPAPRCVQVGAGVLGRVLAALPLLPSRPDILVGLHDADDAAVIW